MWVDEKRINQSAELLIVVPPKYIHEDDDYAADAGWLTEEKNKIISRCLSFVRWLVDGWIHRYSSSVETYHFIIKFIQFNQSVYL